MPQFSPQSYVKIEHPQWCKNATIYQLNTRQFSTEGTFKAAQKQIPRLKELGVDIIWLMPIHPIGEKNRKGSLGSPYAVKDYFEVNPELGSMQDLKDFVAAAHELEMYVILDWVANHTAWDNPLVHTHPEWYVRDYKGDLCPTPWWDWDDIIDLDYSQPALRKYMLKALLYWVKEANIDGYRCDVAGYVPLDFWNEARKALDAVKPVFMLAEWEERDLLAQAFDMTYAWSWYDAVQSVCSGKENLNALYIYYSTHTKTYPKNSLRMTFVSNHDKNAWVGTMWEQFGKGLEAAIALSVIGEGMPLIYNGQEAGNKKRLAFFEKDPIKWQPHPIGKLYKKLFSLMKQNTALWNAQWGAPMLHVPNNMPEQIFSFVRQNEKDKVLALFNFSAKEQTFLLHETLYYGRFKELFSEQIELLDADSRFKLKPWDYKIFAKS